MGGLRGAVDIKKNPKLKTNSDITLKFFVKIKHYMNMKPIDPEKKLNKNGGIRRVEIFKKETRNKNDIKLKSGFIRGCSLLVMKKSLIENRG